MRMSIRGGTGTRLSARKTKYPMLPDTRKAISGYPIPARYPKNLDLKHPIPEKLLPVPQLINTKATNFDLSRSSIGSREYCD